MISPTRAILRDVLELGRRTRPRPYGLIGSFRPLIERELRLEVTERMDAEGQVVTPLAEGAVGEAAARLLELGAEAIVIHFLHSYINPAHERRAAEIVREVWHRSRPGDAQYVTAGHAIISEYREYERMSTTVLDAYVKPVMSRYMGLLAKGLPDTDIFIMQSNGGIAGPSVIRERPVTTLYSGPAGGVAATIHLGRLIGERDLISFDMGGTSIPRASTFLAHCRCLYAADV